MIRCGTCHAVCPAGKLTSLNTRKIMRKTILGITSILEAPDIWYCTTCFNCYENCPRNIPVTEVLLKLRNIAVREGIIPIF